MGYRGAGLDAGEDPCVARAHAQGARAAALYATNEDIMPGILQTQARAEFPRQDQRDRGRKRVRASVENAAEYGLTHADVYELVEALVASGMTDETAVMAEPPVARRRCSRGSLCAMSVGFHRLRPRPASRRRTRSRSARASCESSSACRKASIGWRRASAPEDRAAARQGQRDRARAPAPAETSCCGSRS